MVKAYDDINKHNSKVLRAAIQRHGGDATVHQVKKSLYYSDESTFYAAVKYAPGVLQGGKGLVAR